jgi:hypothetical protein
MCAMIEKLRMRCCMKASLDRAVEAAANRSF